MQKIQLASRLIYIYNFKNKLRKNEKVGPVKDK